MPLTAGTRLGSYEVLGPLGSGGMGEVYLARDLRLDRDVALKLLPRHVAGDPEAVARFRREALTLASLTHPNIATVYGFEEATDGPAVLVLERVEGQTLTQRLGRGALRTEEALQVCAQVAQALEAAHERGVIHRDVKPANVMIGARGLVKLLDFGLARRATGLPEPTERAPVSPRDNVDAAQPPETIALLRSPDASQSASATDAGSRVVLGTPGYMSPEQALGEELDERSDVFAFGCVLYECLTGRRAFTGPDALAILHATVTQAPDLSALPGSTPPRVRALLERCLVKERSQRLAAMRAARIELEEALGIRRASALREGELSPTPHNLPAQTTRLVGRAGVLDECRRRIGSARLLTLTGMGGSGKTRVAVRLAETLVAEYPDGAWFVNLAALSDSGRVAETAAEALGVADEPGRTPLESLTRHVGARRMLFVLDNCEDVAAGARAVASALLAACPETRVLATSREALQLEGEALFVMPPLALPDAGEGIDPEALRGCESVQLFLDRAAVADPEFSLTGANAPAVAEICRRLDGIPLALELAASRIRLLTVEQIRDRLDDRFRLLVRPGGDLPSRRQTVRAVIQWSWDHLLSPEQDLMRRLAVFTGGWTLERAVAVCSASGDEFEMLDLLTRLVERSLVVADRVASGAMRYRFLESVWRFALEQLAASGDEPALRERHLAVYLDFARRCEGELIGQGAQQAVAEIEWEEGNVLAALEFSGAAESRAIRGLQLATSIQRFWSLKGRYLLGRRVLEDALARPGAAAPSPERAWALIRVAGFALTMGDLDAARRRLEESLAYWRAHGGPDGTPPAVLGALGVVAMMESRYEDALALGEEALALYRQRGAERGVAMALHNLGVAEWTLERGDHGRARFEAALELLRGVGDAITEVLCLGSLVSALVARNEIAEACRRMRECLLACEQLDPTRERAYALEAAADLALALGRLREAARLVGAAGAMREATKSPFTTPAEANHVARLLARVELALGAEAANRARAEGWALPVERQIEEARAVLERADAGAL